MARSIGDMYPFADRKQLEPPQGGEVGLYSYLLRPDDIHQTEGVTARYGDPEKPVLRREFALENGWPTGAPLEPPFHASLDTTLTASAYGPHGFRLSGPADASLIIDGEAVATGGGEGVKTLARGSHALRVDISEAGAVPVRLEWRPPGSTSFQAIPTSAIHVDPIRATGLTAELFRGRTPTGQPETARVEPNVETRVHILPLPRPYTEQWTGAIRAHKDGGYRFGTSSIDSSAVWIDGRQVVNNTTPNSLVENQVELKAGWHDIRVEFHDETNFTFVSLFWQPPGEARSVVPTDALRPWPAERVLAAMPGDSDLTPRLRPVTAAAPAASAEAASNLPAGASLGAVSKPGALQQPRGVAVGLDGTVYVADAGLKAIVAFPPDGGEVKLLAKDELREPSDVAVQADGSVLVLDAGAGGAWRLNANGSLGERVGADQALYGPRGIDVASDGRVGIADTGNNRVLVIPRGGQAQSITGLKEPTDLVFLPDGTIVVADTGSKQWVQVRADGNRVASWPMQQSFTVVGPHLGLLPRGGWVGTSPETGALVRMAPGDRQPQSWTIDTPLRKPVGIGVARDSIVVSEADAIAATRIALP